MLVPPVEPDPLPDTAAAASSDRVVAGAAEQHVRPAMIG
jgi:hypothetical protein